VANDLKKRYFSNSNPLRSHKRLTSFLISNLPIPFIVFYFEKMSTVLDPNKLNDLKVTELKEHLKTRGLETSGVKADLVARLKKSLENNNAAEEEDIDVEEDIEDTTAPKATEEKQEPELDIDDSTATSAAAATTTTTTAAPAANQNATNPLDAERKKQRAARFNIPLQETEAEKIKQRAARFNIEVPKVSK
jgi:hypothetical protein